MRKPIYCNRKTKVAHRADRRNDRCRQGQINRENLVRFDSLREAEAAGYRPCGHCAKD